MMTVVGMRLRVNNGSFPPHLVFPGEVLQSSCDERLSEEKPTQPENGGSDAIFHPRSQEVQPKEEVSNPGTKWH